MTRSPTSNIHINNHKHKGHPKQKVLKFAASYVAAVESLRSGKREVVTITMPYSLRSLVFEYQRSLYNDSFHRHIRVDHSKIHKPFPIASVVMGSFDRHPVTGVVIYNLTVTGIDGSVWSCSRRYSSFRNVYAYLKTCDTYSLAPPMRHKLPPRDINTTAYVYLPLSTEQIESRKQHMEEWINELIEFAKEDIDFNRVFKAYHTVLRLELLAFLGGEGGQLEQEGKRYVLSEEELQKRIKESVVLSSSSSLTSKDTPVKDVEHTEAEQETEEAEEADNNETRDGGATSAVSPSQPTSQSQSRSSSVKTNGKSSSKKTGKSSSVSEAEIFTLTEEMLDRHNKELAAQEQGKKAEQALKAKETKRQSHLNEHPTTSSMKQSIPPPPASLSGNGNGNAAVTVFTGGAEGEVLSGNDNEIEEEKARGLNAEDKQDNVDIDRQGGIEGGIEGDVDRDRDRDRVSNNMLAMTSVEQVLFAISPMNSPIPSPPRPSSPAVLAIIDDEIKEDIESK